MLKTKVKIGNVTNLSEARYCAGMGVDFLSFPISSVDPKMYREITGWVAGPKFGIEVDDDNVTSVNEYEPDFVGVSINKMQNFTQHNLIVSLEPKDWLARRSDLLLAKTNILFLELKIISLDSAVLALLHEISEDFQVLLKPIGSWLPAIGYRLPASGLSFDGNPETKPGLKEYPLSEILEQLSE